MTGGERDDPRTAHPAGEPGDAHAAYSADEIAAAWERERPGTPTSSIRIVTPIWRLGALFQRDRERVLREAGIDAATLDLLSTLRRAGRPYRLTTRQLTERTLVTAGATSQRVARAETAGLVVRAPAGRGKTVLVTLTERGHAAVEACVDRVLSSEARLVEGLDDAERRALESLLRRLLTQVRERTG